MLREGAIVRAQASKEDDLFDPRTGRRAREVIRAHNIEIREVALSQLRRGHHVVDQVDGVLAALEGALGLFQREQIALSMFGEAISAGSLRPGEADQVKAVREEGSKRFADEARGPCDDQTRFVSEFHICLYIV